jgi:hypothetical protein
VLKPGLYKVIWHNQYSYMKGKVVRYRLRVLEKKEDDQNDATQPEEIEELFAINELSEREEMAFKAIRQVYPLYNPIIKVTKPASKKL